MKSILSLFTFVMFVSASITPRQVPPSCTLGCVVEGDQTGCSNSDNACWCRSDVWVTGVMKCLAQECPPADLTAAQDAIRGNCAVFGVRTLGGAGSGASTATPTGGSSGSTGTASGSGASPSRTTSNAAVSNGVNALAGIAAVGLALVL